MMHCLKTVTLLFIVGFLITETKASGPDFPGGIANNFLQEYLRDAENGLTELAACLTRLASAQDQDTVFKENKILVELIGNLVIKAIQAVLDIVNVAGKRFQCLLEKIPQALQEAQNLRKEISETQE